MPSIPRPEYPRPHWDRSALGRWWENLNGTWSFEFDDEDVGLDQGWWKERFDKDPFNERIIVPFAHQTKLSGLNEKGVHQVVWYSRLVRKPDFASAERRVLLHFGAVDYKATVWVNGVQVTEHSGGHVAFHCDITHVLLASETDSVRITVRAQDAPYDVTQPRGKQFWKGDIEGIWYYPTTGIWQTVWLEEVPKWRIAQTRITTDIDSAVIHVSADLDGIAPGKYPYSSTYLIAKASLHDVEISSTKNLINHETNSAVVSLNVGFDGVERPSALQHLAREHWHEGVALWSPEHPSLYDVELSLIDNQGQVIDAVKTYTGMRKIHVADGRVYLNNIHYFQALNLDQGYWPDSGLTAPTDDAFKVDIQSMKDVGMNGCRKHQKVEDPRFLYWADRLGYLVWGEMASPYAFSQQAVLRFQQEWTEAVMQQINHPSIISWTPFNESWGVPNLPTSKRQRDYLKAMYYWTKTLDPTRLIISNDGWEQGPSDMLGFHDYIHADVLRNTAAKVDVILMPKAGKDIILPGDPPYDGKPILCTEMGGISMTPKKGDPSNAWGYHVAGNEDELLDRIRGVVDAIIDGNVCHGYCYTQTADCEQETNGILTKDRRHKIDPAKLREVFGRRPHFPR